MKVYTIVACVALSAAAIGRADAAVNLVQDSGFESAGGSGYNSTPSYLPDGVWQQTLGKGFLLDSAANAHSGNNSYAPNGVGGSNATVQQVLATTAGQKYDLQLYYEFDGHGPLTMTFDGLPVSYTSTGSGGWELATASGLLASGPSTTLALSAIGADTLVDDISVTTSTVPEPASIGLLVAGGLGLLSRRRQRNWGSRKGH